jgi:hypothetical protein
MVDFYGFGNEYGGLRDIQAQQERDPPFGMSLDQTADRRLQNLEPLGWPREIEQ